MDASMRDTVLLSQHWDQPCQLTLHAEGSGPASETNSEVTCCIVIEVTSPMAQNLEATYFVSKQQHWWQNKNRIPSGEKTTPKCHGGQGAKGPKRLTVLQTQTLFLQRLLHTRPPQLDGSRACPRSTDSCISGSYSRPAQSRVKGIS